MKKRVFSAIVMMAIFIPLLLLGGVSFAVFMTGLSAMALYELIHIRKKTKPFPTFVKVLGYLLVIFFTIMHYDQNVFSYTMDYRMMAFIIFAFLLPILCVQEKDAYNINDALYMIGSILFVGLSFHLLLLVRNYDLNYLIYLLLITTLTDTFAYLTGRYIGKTPLASEISPNKTVEGLVGGVVMGSFVATAFYFTVINHQISLVFLIFMTVLLSLIGQLGDLVFSSIKRTYQVKDFSNLIPGHGGILDRFDSLIFTILAFVLLLGIL